MRPPSFSLWVTFMDALGFWRVMIEMCLPLPCPTGVIPSLHEGSHSNAILCKIKWLVSTEVQGLSSLSVDYRFPGVDRSGADALLWSMLGRAAMQVGWCHRAVFPEPLSLEVNHILIYDDFSSLSTLPFHTPSTWCTQEFYISMYLHSIDLISCEWISLLYQDSSSLLPCLCWLCSTFFLWPPRRV